MASLPLSAIVVEAFLKKLEKETTSNEPGQQVPGTVLQRVLVQNLTLKQHGVKVSGPDNESSLAWSIGIGPMQMPKRFFYGLTLQELFTLTRKNL